MALVQKPQQLADIGLRREAKPSRPRASCATIAKRRTALAPVASTECHGDLLDSLAGQAHVTLKQPLGDGRGWSEVVNARVVVSLLAAAGVAGANDTVIEVPQGSGVFPTVGQVDCLEELGSGRFCAATYECADDSGELWGDLANHDGRRAIGVDSPVARERDCSITVDGQAAVRWFTGFSPDGRNGALVGVTAKHDAEPPVVRRVATGGSGGDGSFLSWYVERYEIEDVVAEVRHAACGHFEDGTSHEENSNVQ